MTIGDGMKFTINCALSAEFIAFKINDSLFNLQSVISLRSFVSCDWSPPIDHFHHYSHPRSFSLAS